MLELNKIIYDNTMSSSKPEYKNDIPSDELKDKVVALIMKDPNPKDKLIHNLGDKLGVDPDKVEEAAYSLLTTLLLNAPGKHKDRPDSDFDPRQLAMGIEVEKEHTNDPMIAKWITKDHLVENKFYYTHLKKMEDSMKKD